MATPSSRSSRDKRDERLGGAAQRRQIRDLRADVDVQADELEPWPAPQPSVQISRTSSIGMPNLLVFRPVEMCGWLRASMSGLTRSATRVRVWRARAIASIRSSSPSDSALIALTPRSIGLLELRGRLADAGEDDLRRNEAGAQRDVDLAAGVRVGGAAEAAQQPRDGQRRVRLQRVVDRVRMRGERVVDRAIAARDRRGAVDVERRAIGRGERRQAARRRTRACHRVAESRSRNDSISTQSCRAAPQASRAPQDERRARNRDP